MPLEDRFGLPLTTQSENAAEDYRRAVDLMLSANLGAEGLIDRALAADPEFAARRRATGAGSPTLLRRRRGTPQALRCSL